MANKRVSELAAITAPSLVSGDLFLLADVVAHESKKLTLQDLGTYLLTTPGTIANLSGSLFGTASAALFSVTASHVTSVQTASYALTASFALNGGTGGSTDSASWASRSLSSSIADYALSTGNVVLADSASIANSALFSATASYVYYSGNDNGTVFNSIVSQIASTSTSSISSSWASASFQAISASYADTVGVIDSSSYALSSTSASHAVVSDFATFANSASVGLVVTYSFQSSASWASHSLSSDITTFASFSISASYAPSTAVASTVFYPKGVYSAITQSNSKGQLDIVTVTPTSGLLSTSSVEAMGTIVAYYTSSIILNETVDLYILDRTTGDITLLDSTPIFVNIQGQYGNISASVEATVRGFLTGSISGSVSGSFTGSVSGSDASGSLDGAITGSVSASYSGFLTGSISGSVSTALSGAIKFPYSLMGQTALMGSYLVYVTASSSKINLESTRLTRFSFTSTAGTFTVSAGGPVVFTTDTLSDLLSYTVAGPTTAVGSASQVVAAGPENIIALQATSSTSNLRFVWTLTGLQYLDCTNNANITDLGGMPRAIVTMSLSNCNLSTLNSLAATSASILDVSNNQISTVNFLAPSMSYLNLSNNLFTSMPTPLPYGLLYLLCDDSQITTMGGAPFDLPDTIISMSFNSNTSLASWLTPLPVDLKWFSCNTNAALTSLPSFLICPSCSYLDISNGAFTDVAVDTICSELVTNAQNSGSLNIQGNVATYLPSTNTNLTTLSDRAWSLTI